MLKTRWLTNESIPTCTNLGAGKEIIHPHYIIAEQDKVQSSPMPVIIMTQVTKLSEANTIFFPLHVVFVLFSSYTNNLNKIIWMKHNFPLLHHKDKHSHTKRVKCISGIDDILITNNMNKFEITHSNINPVYHASKLNSIHMHAVWSTLQKLMPKQTKKVVKQQPTVLVFRPIYWTNRSQADVKYPLGPIM